MSVSIVPLQHQQRLLKEPALEIRLTKLTIVTFESVYQIKQLLHIYSERNKVDSFGDQPGVYYKSISMIKSTQKAIIWISDKYNHEPLSDLG